MTKLREECGVFGIFDAEEASVLTTLGLHSLQHRGQEGAGLFLMMEKNFITLENKVSLVIILMIMRFYPIYLENMQ